MTTTRQRESIVPIVLVGGKSRRFGRDKLRAAIGDELLVHRPVSALRIVFGARVALVGECHADVAQLGDSIIVDNYPGRGPAGGILSALEHKQCSVFVVAGDMPTIEPSLIRAILREADENIDADAIIASSALGPEPCFGLYRIGAIDALRDAVIAPRVPSLQSVLESLRTRLVAADATSLANINQPEDLAQF